MDPSFMSQILCLLLVFIHLCKQFLVLLPLFIKLLLQVLYLIPYHGAVQFLFK
jgi:hypothetical protein